MAEAKSTDLKRRLRLRHLVMLSVGGTIASGFLLFSGQAIGIAGPLVVVTFVVAGIITTLVMACLAELSVNSPTAAVAGSFATYARKAMGPLAGFLTGWNYWLAWVMGAATESVAAGTYIHVYVSSIPIWVVAAIIVAVEMTVNLVGVLFMGEYEFILSTIKLVALVVFILIGLAAILGIGFSTHGVGNYTNNGGFAPKGLGAAFTALFTVFFAYTGIELVGVAAEESDRPERDVPRALMLTCGIVGIVFIAGILVLMAILPWKDLATTTNSPFVIALQSLHIKVIADIFVLVVIAASLSSVDGGLYTASRMMFALSREGYFPKRLSETHKNRKVPSLAILITSLCIFTGAVLAFFYPSSAYILVASLATFGWMFAWFMIPLSLVIYRRRGGKAYVDALPWKVAWYPVLPIVAMIAVLIALGGQFFFGSGTKIGPLTIPGSGAVVVYGVIWTLVWAIYFLIWGRHFTHGDEWRKEEETRAGIDQIEGEWGVVSTDGVPIEP
jgi:L-asparagine transporter-like permease